MTMTYIGVDVSKSWIDAFDPRENRHTRLPLEALTTFAARASGAQVIFEASSGYDRPLTQALEAARVAYSRVNARQAREFARACGQLAKTDRVDARNLARMGEALQPTPTQAVTTEQAMLSELVARKQDVTAMLGQERNRLLQANSTWIKDRINRHLNALEAEKVELQDEIIRIIETTPALKQKALRLKQVPGVGPHVLAILLARMPELGCLDRRRVAALAGLAPQACESGLMRGKRSVWGGRPDVRRALFIAALVASRWDPSFKAFRARLEANGKPNKVAIIAVARKLLTALNAILRDNTNFKTQPR